MNSKFFGVFFLFTVLLLVVLATKVSAKSDDDILPTPCVNGITKTRKQHEHDLVSWHHCKWQRMDLVSWMDRGFDMDNDGAISFDECQYTRKYYFNEAELVFGESCETVFQRCDCDGDGYIIYEDFRDSVFSCLKDCDAAERVWFYVGSRMVDGQAFNGVQEADQTIDKAVLDQ